MPGFPGYVKGVCSYCLVLCFYTLMFGHSSSVLKSCTLAESLFLLAGSSQNILIKLFSIFWETSKIRPVSDKKKATKSTYSIA